MRLNLNFLKHKNVVLLFTPGLDTFFSNWVLEQRKLPISNLYKIYFDIDGMYSNYEINFLKEKYNNSFDIEKLSIGKVENKVNAHLKNRNIMFTAYAQSIYNPDIILISGMKDDRVSDNNKQFFESFSKILSRSSEKEIKITSLFWEYEKSELVREYSNIDNSENLLFNTYSCYSKKVNPKVIDIWKYQENKKYYIYKNKEKINNAGCLKCKACFRKYCALTEGNIYIPFENRSLLEEYNKTQLSSDFSIQYPNRLKSITNYLDFHKKEFSL
jgi:7-cyano-7-deazaguanine synthase in queuosine biosynthesis